MGRLAVLAFIALAALTNSGLGQSPSEGVPHDIACVAGEHCGQDQTGGRSNAINATGGSAHTTATQGAMSNAVPMRDPLDRYEDTPFISCATLRPPLDRCEDTPFYPSASHP